MENASRALIMAASVLVGVMIISVGVALFNSFSEFSRSTVQKVEDAKIAEWNNNYLKYYGSYTDDNGKVRPIQVTAHDIVSIANSAKQNNINYELDTLNGKLKSINIDSVIEKMGFPKNYKDIMYIE